MANRYLNQYQYTFEKDTVTLYGEFSVGASGAVTANTVKGGGITGVTKETAAGLYTIELADYYQRLLFVEALIVDDAITSTISYQILEDPAALQTDFKTDKKFQIQFFGATNASTTTQIAANPASGAQIKLKIVCRNSTVGPYDA
jgi:hypothetical protein